MSSNDKMTLDEEIAILSGEGTSTPDDPEFDYILNYDPNAKAMGDIEKEMARLNKEGKMPEPGFSLEDYFSPTKNMITEEQATNKETLSLNTNHLDMLIEDVLENEGGYVNHPNDKGGPTNMGITLGTYRSYIDPNGTIDDIKNLDVETAKQIYKDEYYFGMGVDKFPSQIQDLVFDMNVLHGPRNTAKLIQRAINVISEEDVTVDGVIGEQTINKLLELDPDELRTEINDERRQFFKGIVRNNPSQKKFLRGWLNRMSKVEENYLNSVG